MNVFSSAHTKQSSTTSGMLINITRRYLWGKHVETYVQCPADSLPDEALEYLNRKTEPKPNPLSLWDKIKAFFGGVK